MESTFRRANSLLYRPHPAPTPVVNGPVMRDGDIPFDEIAVSLGCCMTGLAPSKQEHLSLSVIPYIE